MKIQKPREMFRLCPGTWWVGGKTPGTTSRLLSTVLNYLLCPQSSGRLSEAESREPDKSCYYDPCHLEEEASLLEHARRAAYWVPQNPGKQSLPDGRDREQPMG